jgi:Uma2 family endonuclease
MATVSAPRGVYTFEDFCWIVPDGQKADLINGVIYMASPDNTDADELFGWLHALILIFVRRSRLGRVFGSRVAFRLDERNGPEPDIAFVCTARLGQVRRGFVLGYADLAIEIVSPDSVERDYEKKRAQYEEAGFKEYWIVDELEKKVTLLRLDAKGKYREIRLRNGLLRSQVLKGFWIDTSWLWKRPLPDEIKTVLRILKTSK